MDRCHYRIRNCLPFRTTWFHPGFEWGSSCSMFLFLCSGLLINVCPFVICHLVIELSVLLRFTGSDYFWYMLCYYEIWLIVVYHNSERGYFSLSIPNIRLSYTSQFSLLIPRARRYTWLAWVSSMSFILIINLIETQLYFGKTFLLNGPCNIEYPSIFMATS